MSKLYLVQAAHWSVPGLHRKIVASAAEAEAVALAFVNDLRAELANDEGRASKPYTSASLWAFALRELKRRRYAAMTCEEDAEAAEDDYLDGLTGEGIPEVWIEEVAADVPNISAMMTALRHASGALSACEDQIGQMSGMFSDEDGTIQDAVDAAEEARDEIEAALDSAMSDPVARVAVGVSGGCVQWALSDRPGVRVDVVDFDTDDQDDLRLITDKDGDQDPGRTWEESVGVEPDYFVRLDSAPACDSDGDLVDQDDEEEEQA